MNGRTMHIHLDEKADIALSEVQVKFNCDGPKAIALCLKLACICLDAEKEGKEIRIVDKDGNYSIIELK